MARLDLSVRAVSEVASGIRLYELADPAGAPLPEFAAGAHIDVEIPGGFLRQYSLCGDPRDRSQYHIAVLREAAGSGGSAALHDGVKPGDRLAVSPPRNNFPIAAGAARHLLLAGGIGVTPMMAMVEQLRHDGADFVLHYCTRSPERTAFRDRLQGFGERIVYHHDQGDPRQGLDIAGLLARHEPGTHLYYCGPAPFMAAVKGAAAHWPAETVHFEYFAPPADARNAKAAASGGFTIRLARSGRELEVPPDRSIVDVLRAAGIEVETSCEIGTCGTCKTRYLAGTPQHNDYILTAKDQQEWVMLCCARAESDVLVLDI
ncbi:MAG: 2Fe-2S iron-sulfur cluster-binding protein [Reyranellaceae bacterium]